MHRSMTLTPVGPGGSASGTCSPNGVTGAGYGSELTVTCTFNNMDVNVYSVQATVGGSYYTGSSEDVLVVFDPSLGFTTGGGWFDWPGTDDKTNFGYTMKYNKKATKVQGSLLLIRHMPDGSIFRVKSNAIKGLALADEGSFGWATFSGKNTYKEPGWPEPIGSHQFVVYVEDHGEPGAGVDRFWIEVRDKDGNLVTLSMVSPAVDNAELLGGGNIVVPHTDNAGGRNNDPQSVSTDASIIDLEGDSEPNDDSDSVNNTEGVTADLSIATHVSNPAPTACDQPQPTRSSRKPAAEQRRDQS